jgi:hypothetical protein
VSCIVFNQLPDAGDVHVDATIHAVPLLALESFHDLFACLNAAGALGEQ